MTERLEARPQRPLVLKSVLQRIGCTQRDYARAVGLPASTAAQLINYGQMPMRKSNIELFSQTTSYLRDKGASPEEIEMAFQNADEKQGDKKVSVAKTTDTTPTKVTTQLPEVDMLTQQAIKHFKLFRNPFIDDVQSSEDVFLSSEQRYIREAMLSTARHGGFMAVIGESGAGKSVLRRDLIDRIRRDNLPITVIQPRTIDKGRLTAAAICDAIVADVSTTANTRRSLEAKARQVEKVLVGSSRSGNSHILIIEEAHDLTLHTLKYLKRFWELEDGFRKLLGILIIGQPELKGKLDERSNWEAREVIRRCEIAELMPLDAALEDYLALKFKRVGAEYPQVFADDAADALRERLSIRTRGTDQRVSMLYPLVVNNAVTRAMNLSAEIAERRVTADVVRSI